MKELADVLSAARQVTWAGQTHLAKASVLAPVLAVFFED